MFERRFTTGHAQQWNLHVHISCRYDAVTRPVPCGMWVISRQAPSTCPLFHILCTVDHTHTCHLVASGRRPAHTYRPTYAPPLRAWFTHHARTFAILLLRTTPHTCLPHAHHTRTTRTHAHTHTAYMPSFCRPTRTCWLTPHPARTYNGLPKTRWRAYAPPFWRTALLFFFCHPLAASWAALRAMLPLAATFCTDSL